MAYSEPVETNATVDLNSEWVSDSEDSNYTYFKSETNVGVGDSYSQCKVTWSNLTSITFKYMSSSEMDYNYLCVGHLDGEKFTSQPSYNSDNVYLSTKSKTSGTYYEFTIECNEGEHHIWFCYIKDSSTNEGEDRGFIGVPKSVRTILDVKQGAELSMEREYGGISAENSKTYDISLHNVTLPNGNIVTDSENVEKTEKAITYEYVDLGLSVKWAKCNIGASSETDYGIFFQWGETSGISGSLVGKYSNENYSWASYKYCEGSNRTLLKYNNDNSYGTVDNKTTLESVDDTATQIMGDEWRMPTQTDFQELLSGTTNEWTTINGVSGIKFTSRTDTSKYIFIPATGSGANGNVYNVGNKCNVWSSLLYTSAPYSVLYLEVYPEEYHMKNTARCYGLPVRGVHA